MTSTASSSSKQYLVESEYVAEIAGQVVTIRRYTAGPHLHTLNGRTGYLVSPTAWPLSPLQQVIRDYVGSSSERWSIL